MSAESRSVRITVVGTGYVGLVTGAVLAEIGHQVTCVDKDQATVEALRQGRVGIQEPGLSELVFRHGTTERIKFTTDLIAGIADAEAIFIAVGTPPLPNGEADLSAVESVVSTIASHLKRYTVIVMRSTVPVGASVRVRSLMESAGAPPHLFDVVSNPEFLRQGNAVADFSAPARIVLGGESDRALHVIERVYAPMANAGIPVVHVSNATAEMAKYAANTFLALKISFINEVANICDLVGANVAQVAAVLGMDQRIGKHFLMPGPGFGGSCLPKDVSALTHTAEAAGYQFRLGQAIMHVNQLQKEQVVERVVQLLGSPIGKRIAVLGLTFKAGTDDLRDSPALFICRALHQQGIVLNAFDPGGMKNAARELPEVSLHETAYLAAEGADLILVLTEWPQFKSLDFHRLARIVSRAIIFDTRNLLDQEALQAAGFASFRIGHGSFASPALARDGERSSNGYPGRTPVTRDAE